MYVCVAPVVVGVTDGGLPLQDASPSMSMDASAARLWLGGAGEADPLFAARAVVELYRTQLHDLW